MSEDYIQKIMNRVTQIMYKNPSVFPIVEEIFIAKDFYKVPDKEAEFYVSQTILSRIGLRFITKTKIQGVDEIRFTIQNIGGLKQNIIDEIEKALIRSILLEYSSDPISISINLIEI